MVSITTSQRTVVQHRLSVQGASGMLALDCYRFDGLEISPLEAPPGAPLGSRLRGVVRTASEVPAAVASARTGGDYLGSYREEWRQFLAGATGGNAPDLCSLADGMLSMATAHASVEAQRHGGTVVVADHVAAVVAEADELSA